MIVINTKELPSKTPPRKETRSVAITYAVARRSKPKECAKVVGRPWSVTISGGASDGRALRARRWSHERRQCARCARVKTSSGVVGTGECLGVAELCKQTVSLRITFNHARRMRQRGQSFHNTGARGSGGGAFSRGGETSESAEESGHNTALTRRGLILEWLS